MVRTLLATLVGVLLLGAAEAETISISPDKTPFKDQRNSRAGTGAGYAGNMSDDGANAGTGRDLFVKYFIEQPDECWKILKAGGCYVCREWSANDRWQERIAPFKAKDEKELKAIVKRIGYDGKHDFNKIAYDFRKKHGIRTLLTLENYTVCTNYVTGARSEDIADVKRVILEYVQWIVDNDYKDQVIGFELGNEPYFGSAPENFAERWAEIVPEIKKIFPEVDIGFTCAEYREGDPDIAAVRRRSTAVDEWFQDGGYYGFLKVNQWTGRFIVAFTNGLKYCNHVIYHFYGGDVADGMGPCGFQRIRHFAKVFPEIADRRVWITEYRERSDEDCRCEQMFSSTLTKAHYVLATTAAPMFDCTSIHQISALSGGFCVADGRGEWIVQWDPAGRNFPDPDFTGRPRIELGPAGPMYRLYNEALLNHPIIVEHGQWGVPRNPEELWAGVLYYGYTHNLENWHLGGEKGPRPKANGAAQWVLAANPEKTELRLLVCNSSEETWKPTFDFPGYRIVGKPHVKAFGCPPEKQQLHQVPGEPRITWEREYDCTGDALEIPPTAVATVEFKVERAKAKVGFLADTHVTTETNSCVLLKKAFELFARQQVDLVAHLGDIADANSAKAYANYAATRAAVFTNGLPREAFSMAFHDLVNSKAGNDWGQADAVWADIAARLGSKQPLYDTFELNGFTFIVAPEWPHKATYEKLVAETCAKVGRDKPVFLLQHRPPEGTTVKSADFGCPDSYVRDDLNTVTRPFLNKFPNLIVLSGHVHSNLRDERCIWQGDFTALSAGCLQRHGAPYTANAVPARTNRNVLVMSLFDREAVFTRYDLATGASCGASWTVPWPFDAKTAPYRDDTLTNRCTTGYFDKNNSEVKVVSDREGGLVVSFGESNAEQNAFPQNARYRVELWRQPPRYADADEEQEARILGLKKDLQPFKLFSRMDAPGAWEENTAVKPWNRNPPRKSVRFSGALISPRAAYRVVVTPESFAGVCGKAIQWEGPFPPFQQPKAQKRGEPDPPPVKLVTFTETWRGTVPAVAASDWRGGWTFTPPAEAWQGPAGAKFRVAYTFASDRQVRLSVQKAGGGALSGGYMLPGLGADNPLRYAIEFTKGAETDAFQLRVAETRAKDCKLTDLVIEREK